MTNSMDPEQLTGAEALRVRAADWLMQQRTSDSWGPEDQQALDVWLAEFPAHLLAYWRLDAAWSRTDRLAALRGSMREMPPGAERKTTFPFLLRAVVATMLALVGGVVFFRHSNAAGGATIRH